MPHPSTRREIISSPDAPAAIGPYSQGLLAGNTLYCSGQIALHPKTGELLQGDIEEEAARALENLGAVLREAGLAYRNVVRCTVYLTDINDYAQVNEVYARYFSESPPAREALQVAALPRGARVEISCIAVR
ncbi:MAG: RidA family protein [Rhodothermales bacterium]|nr:RidA family protein [Rhodothermales bacterium]